MKRLTFTLANNLSALHSELLVAIPALRATAIVVKGNDTTVNLRVPDDADEVAIQAVVDAHDSTVKLPDPRAERLARIAELTDMDRSAWTADQRDELSQLIGRELTE